MAGIRIKTDIESEFVIPKVETPSSAPQLVTPSVLPNPPATTSSTTLSTGSSSAGTNGTDSWREFSIAIDLSKVSAIVDTGTSFLSTLDGIVKTASNVLKVLRLFNSDLKSLSILLKYLVRVIVNNIKQFIDSLASTGIYVTVISPNMDERKPGLLIALEIKIVTGGPCRA